MAKYLTIGEASKELNVPDYVLRFWEKKFKAIHPSKRRGGRRYYSEEDIATIKQIKSLLHGSGYTIKGANVILNNKLVDINTSMASPKKILKSKQQPDLFGAEDFSAESKQKLKELLERLKKAQDVLASAAQNNN
jgi:DNA-binding transcriptional MerR regulator